MYRSSASVRAVVCSLLAAALLSRGVSGMSATARLRSGAPSHWVNIDSEVVDSTQILSPAELEESEEASQEVQSEDEVSSYKNMPAANAGASEKTKTGTRHAARLLPPTSADALTRSSPRAADSTATRKDTVRFQAQEDALTRSTPRAADSIATWKDTVGLQAQEEQAPKAEAEGRRKCEPECFEGRGVCNDGICFCKTPYSGTVCQHETNGDSVRVSVIITAFTAVVSLLVGILAAQCVYGFIRSKEEHRLAVIGDETFRQESWVPHKPEEPKGQTKKR